MQIAMRVHQGWAKNPRMVRLDHEKLKFVRQKVKPTQDQIKSATEISKTVWHMRLSSAKAVIDRRKQAEAKRTKGKKG